MHGVLTFSSSLNFSASFLRILRTLPSQLCGSFLQRSCPGTWPAFFFFLILNMPLTCPLEGVAVFFRRNVHLHHKTQLKPSSDPSSLVYFCLSNLCFYFYHEENRLREDSRAVLYYSWMVSSKELGMHSGWSAPHYHCTAPHISFLKQTEAATAVLPEGPEQNCATHWDKSPSVANEKTRPASCSPQRINPVAAGIL